MNKEEQRPAIAVLEEAIVYIMHGTGGVCKRPPHCQKLAEAILFLLPKV